MQSGHTISRTTIHKQNNDADNDDYDDVDADVFYRHSMPLRSFLHAADLCKTFHQKENIHTHLPILYVYINIYKIC